jgi:hypothetical protein
VLIYYRESHNLVDIKVVPANQRAFTIQVTAFGAGLSASGEGQLSIFIFISCETTIKSEPQNIE